VTRPFRVIVKVHPEPYAVQYRWGFLWITRARCATHAAAVSMMARLCNAYTHRGKVLDRG